MTKVAGAILGPEVEALSSSIKGQNPGPKTAPIHISNFTGI
jgi:hypothetical protein